MVWSNHWLHFAAPKPVGKHEFSDILNAQGFKPTSDQESQTLSSLKKEQNKPDDPIKAKVNHHTTNHTLGIMDITDPWAFIKNPHTLRKEQGSLLPGLCFGLYAENWISKENNRYTVVFSILPFGNHVKKFGWNFNQDFSFLSKSNFKCLFVSDLA